MPVRADISRVMVIGSGPVTIGQAAEFDYAGTQACKALREEGVDVVLVNSNPATIMTDPSVTGCVYIEPLTTECLERVIARERPDGLIPTLGGQVGLNAALDLSRAGVLDRYGVRLLGTPLDAIVRAEDRRLFKATMEKMGQPVPTSAVVSTVADALAFGDRVGFPLVVRPAYTLGGSGGGMASSARDLEDVAQRGLRTSPAGQILVESSVAGWKEIEFEVMRDRLGTCVVVCGMENIDPVGVHTGDSLVVAPILTLSEGELLVLRTASLDIIRALGIEGGCNIQFAVDPRTSDYVVIEVNPRVSRSSALASKATGYPIARVAAKVAVGMTLDEIPVTTTGHTTARFEPVLDYVVVKIPRWPFDKFATAGRHLGTQMKATGEVMAIGCTLESALLKAVRSLEVGVSGLFSGGMDQVTDDELLDRIRTPRDDRLAAVAEALRRGAERLEVGRVSGIDPLFISSIENIIRMENVLGSLPGSMLPVDVLSAAKRLGFSDQAISDRAGLAEERVRAARVEAGINPSFRAVDTCAPGDDARTPYFYSLYDGDDQVPVSDRKTVVVLGSGPIRIGQGIEFDYCSVHAAWALQEQGYEAVIINNNPETVSTDSDVADRLYFEPLSPEDVRAVIDREQPDGVLVQFGGQTAINLAAPLVAAGVPIIGTSLDSIDIAEDRERFDTLLASLGIPRPAGFMASTAEEAVEGAGRVGYPVVVRPSYVLGGRAMEIISTDRDLSGYMAATRGASFRGPVLVDRYLGGVEIEVDAVSDGDDVLIPGVLQHIERAGVHSGDSIAVYPAHSLDASSAARIQDYTVRLARALDVRGMINVQYVVHRGEVFVLEVNPRSSRTVPFLSKVTGVPLVSLATRAALGQRVRDMGWGTGLMPPRDLVAVKAPVFSFAKLTGLDVSLGPEMKSTGEVMGIDDSLDRALYKAFMAAGVAVPESGTALVTIADRDKLEAVPLIRELSALGIKVHATSGTACALEEAGLKPVRINKVADGPPHVIDLIRSGKVDLVVNTFTTGGRPERDGFRIRRAAVEMGVPCITSLDTLGGLIGALASRAGGGASGPRPLEEYVYG